MNVATAGVLARGMRVGLAVKPFGAETADYEPLQDALNETAALVTALEEKQATQDVDTSPTTLSKDQQREVMAVATQALSNRLVGYALVLGDLGKQRAWRLSYSDVRFGEADEDVNDVRALVAQARDLPADIRTKYKLTAALIAAPEDAATAFEKAEETQTTSKADARLATLSIPQLETRLRKHLELVRVLAEGMRPDGDRWVALADALKDANKGRKEPASRRLSTARKVVKRLSFQRQDDATARLDKQNYGPAYELEIKNASPSDALLWMGFEKTPTGAAPPTAFRAPAGQTSTVRRDVLGEELARYLTAKFVDAAGGEVRIAVRRVVEAA